jgi:hypothetical protein
LSALPQSLSRPLINTVLVFDLGPGSLYLTIGKTALPNLLGCGVKQTPLQKPAFRSLSRPKVRQRVT